MNYTQFFANGGKVDTKTIKSEIGRIFQIDDENKINTLWQNAVQEYGSDENVLNALLTEIGGNTSDESIQSAMMKVLNYTPMESQYFKCGGKLQQLVTKFGKGGPVDCGCGGIKLDEGGRALPEGASRTITQRDTTDWYPFRSGMIKSVHPTNGDAPTYQVFDGTTVIAPKYSVAPKLENEIGIFAKPFQYFGAARRITPEVAAEYETARQNTFTVPSKQDGGTVELTQLPGHDVDTRLTRRQARQLAMDKGRYANNAQFQTAMANAMNAVRSMGLRGQEARQRAMEMVAGVSPAERTVTIADPPVADINTFDFNKAKEIPDYVEESGTVRKFGQVTPILDLPATRTIVEPKDRKADPIYGILVNDMLKRIGTQNTTTTPETTFNKSDNPLHADRFDINGNPILGRDKNTYQKNKPSTQVKTSDSRNFGAGRNQYYLNVTGGQDALDDWGVKLFEYADPNSEAYQAGQRQARKEAGITTAAGIATAAALPAALNAATTYIPEAIRYVRLAKDLNNTRNAAQAARGTGQLLMRNTGARGLQTAEQVQAGWNGGLGAMRDGIFLHKQGGQIEKDITKTLKCGGKTKKK